MSNANTKPLRQGDILLVPVERLPARLTEAKRDQHERYVLAEGEHHGHAHALRGPNVTAFRNEAYEGDPANRAMVDFILVGGSGADLKHELATGAQAEHAPVSLAPGAYKVVQQREELPNEGVVRALD